MSCKLLVPRNCSQLRLLAPKCAGDLARLSPTLSKIIAAHLRRQDNRTTKDALYPCSTDNAVSSLSNNVLGMIKELEVLRIC
jgi:hypothetical protein